MNKLKRILAALLCALLMAVAWSTVVLAAGIESRETHSMPSVNDTSQTIAFGGHEWYVIGNGNSGIEPIAGHLTLLAKNSFGDVAFRNRESSDTGKNYTYYQGFYYEGAFSQPSDYSDSTLMNLLTTAANNMFPSGSKEFLNVSPRDLSDVSVNGQTLWPLSLTEYQ